MIVETEGRTVGVTVVGICEGVVKGIIPLNGKLILDDIDRGTVETVDTGMLEEVVETVEGGSEGEMFGAQKGRVGWRGRRGTFGGEIVDGREVPPDCVAYKTEGDCG
jgi:hypothetical protein